MENIIMLNISVPGIIDKANDTITMPLNVVNSFISLVSYQMHIENIKKEIFQEGSISTSEFDQRFLDLIKLQIALKERLKELTEIINVEEIKGYGEI